MRFFKTAFIACCCAMITAGCSRYEYPKQLVAADSTLSVKPDSAMHLLKAINISKFADDERAANYYRLLRIKADDKNYITHKTDSVILRLVDYYERRPDDSLLTQAYYYAGSVYRDLNDAPEAIAYFQKAADRLADENNLRLESNTYTQMGFLNMFLDIEKEANRLFWKSYKIDSILKDTIFMIAGCRNIGNSFVSNFDSTLFYYQKALDLAKENKNDYWVMRIKGQMARYYIAIGDLKTAEEYIKPMIEHPEISTQESTNSMALRIFFGKKDYKKAEFHAQKLIEGNDISLKALGYYTRAKIYATTNNPTKALDYMSLYEKATNEAERTSQTEAMAKANALYNYNLREKENDRLKLEKKDTQISYTIAICVIVLFVVSTILYYIKNREKAKRMQLKMILLEQINNKQQIESKSIIAKSKQEIENLRDDLSSANKKNEYMQLFLNRQKEQIEYLNNEINRQSSEKDEFKQRLYASDIYKTTRNILLECKPLKSRQWKLMEDEFSTQGTSFVEKLRAQFKLSEHEIHICMLVKMGMTVTESGILIGRTTGAVSLAKKRMYKKMFNKEGNGKELEEYINSL